MSIGGVPPGDFLDHFQEQRQQVAQSNHDAWGRAVKSAAFGVVAGALIDRAVARRRATGEAFTPAGRAGVIWLAFVLVGIACVMLIAGSIGHPFNAALTWGLILAFGILGLAASRRYLRSWQRRKGHLPQRHRQPLATDVRDQVFGQSQSQQPEGTWMQDPAGGWHFIR